jgi:large subunit ribosomal protein L35
MKTKSGAKKRFRLTASGKVKFASSRKRHNLRKRSQKMKRQARNARMMAHGDGAKTVKQWLHD